MNDRHDPPLRQDARQLARSTGSGAAAFFWGTLAVLGALYGLGKLFTSPNGWAWMVIIAGGIAVVVAASAWAEANPPPPGGGVPRWTPPPSRRLPPDLRESDVFEGKW